MKHINPLWIHISQILIIETKIWIWDPLRLQLHHVWVDPEARAGGAGCTWWVPSLNGLVFLRYIHLEIDDMMVS